MSELLQYKCPNCGGAIEFDSSLQKMKCPYCDAEFDVEALKKYDEEQKERNEDKLEWESHAGGQWREGEADGMKIYMCQSCGGEIICDETTAASSCPYCDNPIVMKGQFSGELKPDYVIPFKLDKEAAKKGFKNHLKGKRLLNKVFKTENHIDEIKGVYVPFWLFDSDVDASIRYRATKIRSWSDSKYNYTETSYFSVRRDGQISFEKVPVDGSSKMADDLMESLEPFDFREAVDFQTAYLAGYLADKYDVSEQQSEERASQRIKTGTEEAFKATIKGYNTVTPENSGVRMANSSAKYALFPVWILNTTWNGEKYVFAMNGQTGKFVGNLPLDKGAYIRWLLGVAASVTAVGIAGAYLLWLL